MIYLGKFEEIENYFQSKLLNPKNNINYNIKFKNVDEEIKFVSLHIINLIGLLNYDKAYQMTKDAIKYFCNKNSNYLYQIYLEYFYIGIYREYIYLEDKNSKFSYNLKARTEKIATELIDVLKRLIQLLDIKKKRLAKVMKAQQKISYSLNKKHVNEIMEGLVIGRDEHGNYLLRSYWNAPDDVDGKIFFTSNKELHNGDIVKVKITGAFVYDLMGEQYEN